MPVVAQCNTLEAFSSVAGPLLAGELDVIAIFDASANLLYTNVAGGTPPLSATEGTPSHHAALLAKSPPSLNKALHTIVKQTLLTGKPQTISRNDLALAECAPDCILHIVPLGKPPGHITGALAFSYHGNETSIPYQPHYLKALLDSFPFMIWVKDKKGNYLEVNRPLLDCMGKQSEADVYGKSDHDLFATETADIHVQADKHVIFSGESLRFEEEIRSADGTLYTGSTCQSPLRVGRDIIGTVGFTTDISDRQLLKKQVARQSAEYRSLIEYLPVMVFKYDMNCRRTYANALAYQSAADIQAYIHLGKTPAEAWSPSITNMSGEAFTELIAQVIRTGVPHTCEIHTNYHGHNNVCSVRLVPELNEYEQVIGAITFVQNISESFDYRKKIEFLAYFDSLTQLPNRTQFREQLENKLQSALTSSGQLSVMIIDLDHFKNINDALGHSMGDSVLVEVAKRLQLAILPYQDVVVARLGGDEFSVFCDGLQGCTTSTTVLAEIIIESLSAPIMIDDKELFIGASIGISSFPAHADNASDLLKFADTAMYLAKREGRNNVQHFKPEINNPINYAHEVRTQLSHAIENNELYLEYQPIFDLRSGNLVKYEALLRWHNKKLGQVGPEQFIPIAEEFGLISVLGDWVLHQVMRAAVIANQYATHAVRFSVNLSPRQFLRNQLKKTVHTCLLATACPPEFLEFEITERLLLEHSHEVLETLQEWTSMGIEIAIDDFGTGYSSLSYLNKFPIANVKIDKSFVRDICSDPDDATLIKAIINMGSGLGKTVTAEGIETEQQRQLLQAWDCHLGQGFLLGRPQKLTHA